MSRLVPLVALFAILVACGGRTPTSTDTLEGNAQGALGLSAKRIDLELDCASSTFTMRAMVRSTSATVTAHEGWLMSGTRRVAHFEIEPATISPTPTEIVAKPGSLTPIADACARCDWEVYVDILTDGAPATYPDVALASTPAEPLPCVK